MKNIQSTFSKTKLRAFIISLALVSFSQAAEQTEKPMGTVGKPQTNIKIHDIKELEEWKETIEKKHKSHRTWCFKCKKPFTVNNVQYSGDCPTAINIANLLKDHVDPGLRAWGQNSKDDAMVLGRLEVRMTAKYIEGKGYNKKAVWDDATGDYKLVDEKY